MNKIVIYKLFNMNGSYIYCGLARQKGEFRLIVEKIRKHKFLKEVFTGSIAMEKGLTLIMVIMFFATTLISCSNAPGQADDIVGRWQGDTIQIEFFDNGLVIVNSQDRRFGEAFDWQQGDGFLYIDNDLGVEINLHEGETYYQPSEPQAIHYEISGNILNIEWDASFRGSFSGEYTRLPMLPLDCLNEHPLLGTWEYPSEEWVNARGLWDLETITFAPNGFGISSMIMEMEHKSEMPFRWMVRGNQVYLIMDGMVDVVDFYIAEERLYISDNSEEAIVLTKKQQYQP